MKKKILFVMNNLNCGGAEKALISLLETMDYSLYEVDLFLFKHEGLFLHKIPYQVTLIEEPQEYKYFDMSITAAIKDCIKKGRLDIVLLRVMAGYIFKTEKSRARCEQRVWSYLSISLRKIKKHYDVAVGFLEKNPIYFCIDKVKATRKIGFIHTHYDKLGMDPQIDKKYFKKIDNIVTVSKECANVIIERFPMYRNKVEVIHNIISPYLVKRMSLEAIEIGNNDIVLTSVGRLNPIKGFDLAIEACKILVDNGYGVKWYVIGEGEERINLEKSIEEKNLQNNFILIGLRENPYPYIREADIYVQPSRFEGKSIAIDEAKILSKPIVVTSFSTVKDQIVNEENGLVVEMDPVSLAKGIKKIIDDDQLRIKLVNNLLKETLGTESEIRKLYKLFKVV